MLNYTKKYLSLLVTFFFYWNLCDITVRPVRANPINNFYPMETTHLKSTAGAGVGSINDEETAFLNPATNAFFNESSSIYFTWNQLPKNNALIICDDHAGFGSTISYANETHLNYIRTQLGLSAAATIFAPDTSFGFSVKHYKDVIQSVTQQYYTTSFGVLRSAGKNFSLGLLYNDAFNSKAHETTATIGIQTEVFSYISFIGDAGVWVKSDSPIKKPILKGAFQVKVWDSFYLKVGLSDDKTLNIKSSGYGASWIQPKLSLSIAQKNTEQNNTKLKETSFSVALRF